MTCGYVSTNVLLGHGPLIAGVSALLVSPGLMLLLAAVLERRLVRPSTAALGFLFGDVLLALAVALAVTTGPGRPCGVAGTWGQLVMQGIWLLFGWWQWRNDVTQQIYTRAQAVSPTKLWHQFVVYPVLGSWVLLAELRVVTRLPQDILTAIAVLGLVAMWIGLCAYDTRRPKLNHVPYNWRQLRPVDPPWSPDSQTLRTYHLG